MVIDDWLQEEWQIHFCQEQEHLKWCKSKVYLANTKALLMQLSEIKLFAIEPRADCRSTKVGVCLKA